MKKNTITYDEVKVYYERHLRDFEASLYAIESKIGDAKVSKDLPVYSTKKRVKAHGSTYLKAKRDPDYESLEKMKDIAGFRILCLFEKDIFEIHKYILSAFSPSDTNSSITDIKTFNWDKTSCIRLGIASPVKAIHKNKGTGYKSIHYVILWQSSIYVEIQLRTLLQDVWSELEHKLNYKQGNIHPHIKKSFELLSRDIQTNDKLLNHLTTIYEQEVRWEKGLKRAEGPHGYFDYDKIPTPSVLTNDNAYMEYASYCQNHLLNNQAGRDICIKKAYELFINLKNKIYRDNHQAIQNDEFKYFLEMEEVFYLFASPERTDESIKKARGIYTAIINDSKYKNNAYIPYYRRGEINLAWSNEDDALAVALDDFDKCEQIADCAGSNVIPRNRYLIKTWLAYIFWQNGQEYLEYATDKIDEVYDLYTQNKNCFTPTDVLSLYNNLCYYHLDRFIVLKTKANELKEENKEKKDIRTSQRLADIEFKKTKKYFNLLKESMTDKNSDELLQEYDTAAWFCYQRHLFCKDADNNDDVFLTDAVKYIEKAFEKDKKDDLIKNHYLEINMYAEKQKRDMSL